MTRIAALVLLVSTLSAPLGAQDLSKASTEELYAWANAVRGHAPGQPDAALRHAAGLSYPARVRLNSSFALFIRMLDGEAIETRTEFRTRVMFLAQAVRRDPGAAAFLKRAAILHADAAVFADRFPGPRDGPQGAIRPSPLLSGGRVVIVRDGQVVGEASRIWHLPFARSLLDLLMKTGTPAAPSVGREDREFTSAWYHAVAALLFARGRNADATSHLRQAEHVLPDDSRALFDRATYAEAFGLSIYQAIDDTRIPSENRTNEEAERLYRRAIDVDPSYVEARVRLARLLDLRGRHDEAASEVARALAARPEGIVAFYAHIVAGRIAVARGRYDEAYASYREASALFGRAQSARLGASQAALMRANLAETLEPIAGLGDLQTAPKEDPWLEYHLGEGRSARALLAALWQRSAK